MESPIPVAVPKAGPAPLPELAAYLAPFAPLFRRAQSRQSLERYVTGLLTDLPAQELRHHRRRRGGDVHRAAAAPADRRRLGARGAGRGARAAAGRAEPAGRGAGAGRHGAAQEGDGLGGGGPAVLRHAGQGGQLPGGGQRRVRRGRAGDEHAPALAGQRPAVPARGLGRGRRRGASGRTCPRRWSTRPSRSWAWRWSTAPGPGACPSPSSWPTRATARRRPSWPGWRPAGCPTPAASSAPSACASPTRSWRPPRRPRRPTRDGAAPPCPARPPCGTPRPCWPVCRRRPGRRSPGARAPRAPWPSSSSPCGCTAPPATRTWARTAAAWPTRWSPPAPSAGCWASGPLPGHQGEPKQFFLWLPGWPLETPLARLVTLAHARWAIEQAYEDAKGECGLDDYQGRRWDGLHRHLALTWLAYTFLVLQRLAAAAPLDEPDAPAAPGFPPLGGRAD